MSLLLRTNDLVLISAVEALLSGARIDYFVADTHTSVMEGIGRRYSAPGDGGRAID